eukprot:m51a1_g9153 putative phosphoglycerate mutase (214) ;mRNA; f:123355-124064
MEAVVVFVRHGETEWNRDNRVQGHTDTALSSAGLSQAQAVASALARDRFDLVACSPLKRARDTATAIADRHPGTPLRLFDGLKEMGFGELEGHVGVGDTPEAREFGRLYDAWEDGQGLDAGAKGGESPAEVLARASRALDEALECVPAREDASPKRLLVVGHRRCLRILVSTLVGAPLSRVQMPNTSVSTLRRDRSGSWTALSLDDTAHIANN